MTQWNAVDRERSGWGPGCVKLVAVLFSAEREHSLSDAQDRSAYALKSIRHAVYCNKMVKRESPNVPRAPPVPFQGKLPGGSPDMSS